MSYMNQEAWEQRRRYIARRNAQNAEIETLTEDQHDVLQWLCAMRHDIHAREVEIINNYEHPDYDRITNALPQEWAAQEGKIAEELRRVGLPSIELESIPIWTYNDIDDDGVSGDLIDELVLAGYAIPEEPDYDNMRDICYDYIDKYVSNVNDTIEAYLRSIDEEHETNYCPLGQTRGYLL